MKPIASKRMQILEALLVVTAAWLLAPEPSRAQLPPLPPPPVSACSRFELATGWKGTFTIVGTGSGTFPDGGSYTINESIAATPDLSSAGPGEGTGALNETIHIDDIETHPDPTAPNGVRFTHIVDDETIPKGPVFTTAGLPGAALQLDLANCKFFEFDFDPSNNAITTTELGVLFTQGEVFFLGGQQGGITYAPGAITTPLPASGLALSTSVSFTALGSGLGELATWTITLSLQPVLDLDLIVSIPQYPTWRPTAGMTESDTGVDDSGKPNLLDIQATLRNKSTGQLSDVIPDDVTFKLADVSSEPGVAMNWPSVDARANPSPPDLNFDPKVAANQFLKITANGTQADFTPLFPSSLIPFEAVLSPHDWGGWATLNVTATISDQTIQGHFQSDPKTNILLPKRQSVSQHVADVWKTQNNVPLSTPDSDDSEVDPQGRSDCVGDGFTLYEEYRGFMENGKHIEGDPTNKDFFIVNEIGGDAEPGIFLFTALSGLTVHKDIRLAEVQTTTTEFGDVVPDGDGFSVLPVEGKPMINFNHSLGAHQTDQHGVLIRTCDQINQLGTGAIIGIDGGQTIWKSRSETIADHAQPATTRFVCLQGRDAPGTVNPENTHGNVITGDNALLQYDVAVAHELMHSVGVLHHGDLVADGQDTEGIVSFDLFWPQTPKNMTDQPIFQLHGQTVKILDERTEGDYALTVFQAVQNQLSQCAAIVNNPSGYADLVVENCKAKLFFAVNDPGSTFGIYVGLAHGKHSGNDQCLMRYPFAQAYPSAFDASVFYVVLDGTEPLGFGVCSSPAGTGVNDPNRGLPPLRPQPRYFDAHPGRGSCKTWVCVSDQYPPQADSQ